MDSGTPIRGGNGEPPSYHTLPHNTEAEMAFFGAVFIEDGNTILEAVAAFLKPEHFTYPPHGLVYEATLRLNERGQPVDPITLKGFFEAEDSLIDIGGAGYLAQLVAAAVTPTNAREYARIISELWLRREIIAAGEDLAQAAYDAEMSEKTEDILERHEAALAVLADHDGADQGGLIPLSEIVSPTLDEIEHVAANKGTIGLTTGLVDLDRFTGGLMKNDMVVIAGRPGLGKTALALTIARANAVQGRRIGFFSLEMSSEQLTMRVLATNSGISASSMRSGDVSEVQVASIRDAGSEVESLPLMIDDRSAAPVSYIRSQAKNMKRKKGLDLLIVDYLGLVRPENRYAGNRVHEVSEITAGFKSLAKDLAVPLVLLSQLNRSVEQREDRRPRLSDLRDSGSIEQDADVVMLLYRESYYLEMDGPPKAKAGESDGTYTDRLADWHRLCDDAEGTAEILISKNRQGKTGKVNVHFSGTRTMFGDLAQ